MEMDMEMHKISQETLTAEISLIYLGIGNVLWFKKTNQKNKETKKQKTKKQKKTRKKTTETWLLSWLTVLGSLTVWGFYLVQSH